MLKDPCLLVNPMRFTKKVVAQGHVTVPADLRTACGISAGDLVEFAIVGIRRRSASTPAPTLPSTTATATPQP